MKRGFGWKTMARIWRGAVRMLIDKSFKRKGKKNSSAKAAVEFESEGDSALPSTVSASTGKAETQENDCCVNDCRETGCVAEPRETKEAEGSAAKAEKPNDAKETSGADGGSAFDVGNENGLRSLGEDDFDLLDSPNRESLQTLLAKEFGECDSEELRLDFWESEENDATSLSSATRSERDEEAVSEDDAQADDLRLSFWEDEDDEADDDWSPEKTRWDETAQVKRSNGLGDDGERAKRAGRNVKKSAQVEKTSQNRGAARRRGASEDGGRRKKEKKTKNVNSSNAAYYDPFSGMETETLDGLLYDFFNEFDAVQDEIEAERIVDYYDWTYGGARYREESDDWE